MKHTLKHYRMRISYRVNMTLSKLLSWLYTTKVVYPLPHSWRFGLIDLSSGALRRATVASNTWWTDAVGKDAAQRFDEYCDLIDELPDVVDPWAEELGLEDME